MLAVRGQVLYPNQHEQQRQHAAHALAQESRPGHARHAHVEGLHEKYVHEDVGRGRGRQEEKRRTRVAQRGKHAGRDVIKEHKGQTPAVDVQIELRVGEDLLGRIDQAQKQPAARDADHHQHPAQRRAADEGGRDGRPQVAIPARAEELGQDDRAADVAAEREGDENQCDFIAVAHGGQRVFADKLAGDQAVGDVVKLLKYHAAEQRQTKAPQHRRGLADGQIPVHEQLPFSLDFLTEPYYTAKDGMRKMYI